jgi:hypothetical protein
MRHLQHHMLTSTRLKIEYACICTCFGPWEADEAAMWVQLQKEIKELKSSKRKLYLPGLYLQPGWHPVHVDVPRTYYVVCNLSSQKYLPGCTCILVTSCGLYFCRWWQHNITNGCPWRMAYLNFISISGLAVGVDQVHGHHLKSASAASQHHRRYTMQMIFHDIIPDWSDC